MYNQPNSKQPLKIYNKKDAKHAAAGGLTNLLALAAGMAMTVYYVLIARFYGPAVQGLYVYGFAMIEVLIRLSPLGTDKGLLRHIPAHRVANELEWEERSLSTATWMTLLGGLGLALAAFFLADSLAEIQKKPESSSAIRLLAGSIPFGALIVVLISGTMGAKIIRYNLYVRGLAQPILLMIIALTATVFGTELYQLCMSHLLATLLTTGIALFAVLKVFRHFSLKKLFLLGISHWEMIRFSVPLGLSEFLNAVMHRINLLVLGLYVTDVDLAFFFAADHIARLVSNARNAFDPVASPVLSEAIRQGDRARLGYNLKLMSRWVTLLAVPVITFTFFFGSELLLLFGKAYMVGLGVLMVLISGHLFNSLLGLTGWVLVMSGRSKLILMNNALAAGINLTLSLVFIPKYGMIAAAFAWSISVASLQLYHLLLVYLFEKVHPISYGLAKAMIAGVVSCLVIYVLNPLLPTAPILKALAGAGLILISFFITLAFMGLEAEDAAIYNKFFNKLKTVWKRK